MKRPEGERVVGTGSPSGIGEATSRCFAEEGASFTGATISLDGGETAGGLAWDQSAVTMRPTGQATPVPPSPQ